MSAPTTIDTELLAQIDHLDKGAHPSPEDGYCVMEAVAWVAGESFSDAPQCACPVIAAYCRALNDRMPDDQRQRLLPYIVRLAGSRSTAQVERMRGYKAATLAVQVFAPLALDVQGLVTQAETLRVLDVQGLVTQAETLRVLSDITDLATASGARTAARAARAARAAADAAYDAATYAADAAYDAASAAACAADAAAYAADDAAAAASVWDAAAYAADDAAAAASVWDAALAGLDALLAITEEGTR